MTQYGFYFDSARCTGCKTCELACKDYKDLSAKIPFRVVYDYEGGGWDFSPAADGGLVTTAFAYHVSAACNHCTLPACLVKCPSGAIIKDGDTGLVYIEEETCIGCGDCVSACPYKVPRLDTEAKKARKCDGCKDRVAEGKTSICAEACPLRALELDDVDKLKGAHASATNVVAPLPDPSQTQPNVLINPCPAAKPLGDTTGVVINNAEVA